MDLFLAYFLLSSPFHQGQSFSGQAAGQLIHKVPARTAVLHAAALPPKTFHASFHASQRPAGVAASVCKTEKYTEWRINWPLEKKDHSDKT